MRITQISSEPFMNLEDEFTTKRKFMYLCICLVIIIIAIILLIFFPDLRIFGAILLVIGVMLGIAFSIITNEKPSKFNF